MVVQPRLHVPTDPPELCDIFRTDALGHCTEKDFVQELTAAGHGGMITKKVIVSLKNTTTTTTKPCPGLPEERLSGGCEARAWRISSHALFTLDSSGEFRRAAGCTRTETLCAPAGSSPLRLHPLACNNSFKELMTLQRYFRAFSAATGLSRERRCPQPLPWGERARHYLRGVCVLLHQGQQRKSTGAAQETYFLVSKCANSGSKPCIWE